MEFVFEVVLQLLGELLVPLVFELLVRLGMRSLDETFGKPKNAMLATIGFILLGAMAGGLSLLILPMSFIHGLGLRTLNLILTPIAVAGIMAWIGRGRRRKGRDCDALDRFGNAYFFALAMTSVRFLWAV